jgi:hypothetical protein
MTVYDADASGGLDWTQLETVRFVLLSRQVWYLNC